MLGGITSIFYSIYSILYKGLTNKEYVKIDLDDMLKQSTIENTEKINNSTNIKPKRVKIIKQNGNTHHCVSGYASIELIDQMKNKRYYKIPFYSNEILKIKYKDKLYENDSLIEF